ncbi:MAG: htpX [Acidimicrobiales bacterium]|nr:htpX [Acidimicrobiales bacterium]
MHDQVAQNKRRSIALSAIFVVITAAVLGGVLALFDLGVVGLAIAVVAALALAFVCYWKADAVVLRMGRAVPADPTTYARVHNVVEGLCIASGLPKPRIYVIDDVAPNAFATGRSRQHAAIAITTGLLDQLDRMELEAVLAHELSHIKNDDILVTTLAVTTVGFVTLVADCCIRLMWWNGGRRGREERTGGTAPWLGFVGLGILSLSPVLSRLMQLAVRRDREALADVSAIRMTRYPPGLISALEKLRDDTTVVASSARATAHLWLAAPVARVEAEGRLSKWNRLFDSHPAIEDRIAVLREL